MNAFDTYDAPSVASQARKIKNAGFGAVGLYLFKSSKFKKILDKQSAQAISDAGLKIFSIWENMSPTTAGYFTTAKGVYDGQIAAEKALEAGQPAGSSIIACFDYDSTPADMGQIVDYFTAFRLELNQGGYTASCYANGLVCRHLKQLGLAHFTMLSESKGFAGYADWKPSADIVQITTQTLFGLDVDTDTILNQSVLWSL